MMMLWVNAIVRCDDVYVFTEFGFGVENANVSIVVYIVGIGYIDTGIYVYFFTGFD